MDGKQYPQCVPKSSDQSILDFSFLQISSFQNLDDSGDHSKRTTSYKYKGNGRRSRAVPDVDGPLSIMRYLKINK